MNHISFRINRPLISFVNIAQFVIALVALVLWPVTAGVVIVVCQLLSLVFIRNLLRQEPWFPHWLFQRGAPRWLVRLYLPAFNRKRVKGFWETYRAWS